MNRKTSKGSNASSPALPSAAFFYPEGIGGLGADTSTSGSHHLWRKWNHLTDCKIRSKKVMR